MLTPSYQCIVHKNHTLILIIYIQLKHLLVFCTHEQGSFYTGYKQKWVDSKSLKLELGLAPILPTWVILNNIFDFLKPFHSYKIRAVPNIRLLEGKNEKA